jgi:hypothetical protein
MILPITLGTHLLKLVWKGAAFPAHLPTFVARALMFKFSLDTMRLPALGDLLRALARWVLGSNWVGRSGLIGGWMVFGAI